MYNPRVIIASLINETETQMSSRELIRMLMQDGWVLKRVTGDHHHFTHPVKPGLVTVPHPKKDLTIKTYRSILKQAGLK